jgi:hypothetical protein
VAFYVLWLYQGEAPGGIVRVAQAGQRRQPRRGALLLQLLERRRERHREQPRQEQVPAPKPHVRQLRCPVAAAPRRRLQLPERLPELQRPRRAVDLRHSTAKRGRPLT